LMFDSNFFSLISLLIFCKSFIPFKIFQSFYPFINLSEFLNPLIKLLFIEFQLYTFI
jgi:hypothetical protein